jgi:hypothetical protein
VSVLVTVVVQAEALEVPELRLAELLDRLVVVDLEIARDVTPLDVTLPVHLLDRGAQPRRDRASRMRHGEHIGAIDDDCLHEGVVEEA